MQHSTTGMVITIKDTSPVDVAYKEVLSNTQRLYKAKNNTQNYELETFTIGKHYYVISENLNDDLSKPANYIWTYVSLLDNITQAQEIYGALVYIRTHKGDMTPFDKELTSVFKDFSKGIEIWKIVSNDRGYILGAEEMIEVIRNQYPDHPRLKYYDEQGNYRLEV